MNIRTNGTQKESVVLEIPKKEPRLLHNDIPYDSQKPEETIRNFVGAIKNMIARYEDDVAYLGLLNNQKEDIEHEMEVGKFKNVPEGYKVYRALAEIRRDRRACKNEIDLLWPIYEYFHGTEVLNRLSKVQGDCAKLKETIDARVYTVRTDILDELKEPKPQFPRIGLNLNTGETIDLDEEEKAHKKWHLAWSENKTEATV